MATGTGIMGNSSSAYQSRIIMAGTTLRSGHSHETCMVKRGGRMQRIPGTRMTGSTGTANTKGLANGREEKSSVSIMTAGTVGMRIRINAYKGIIMAVDAAGTCCYQRCMVRGRFRMVRCKVSDMAGSTVAGS